MSLPRAGAEAVGNTYVSPQFGFSVTWAPAWEVEEEVSGVGDYLALTNGRTEAMLKAIWFGTSDAMNVAETLLTSLQNSVAVSDLVYLSDESGNVLVSGDATHAVIAFTYSSLQPDKGVVSEAMYLDVRLIEPGRSVLVVSMLTPPDQFLSELPNIQRLVNGITVPDLAQRRLATGELAPVLVAGPWRIAVATLARNRAFSELGLVEQPDYQWMVIVLDVTNWSSTDRMFVGRDIGITADHWPSERSIATDATTLIAERLGTTRFDPEAGFSLSGGDTARVALAYLTPISTSGIALMFGERTLSLNVTPAVDLAPSGMPPLSGPPPLSTGVITSVTDSDTIVVAPDVGSMPLVIDLIGITPPENDNWQNELRRVLLSGRIGSRVIVERDAGIRVPIEPDAGIRRGNLSAYIWLINKDGTRTMLNELMLQSGLFRLQPLPNSARFGLALTECASSPPLTGLGSGERAERNGEP